LALYRTLGVNLVLSEPSQDDKRNILNQVWKDVTSETDVKKYIDVVEVWISYPLTHLSVLMTFSYLSFCSTFNKFYHNILMLSKFGLVIL
jgi:hypothetical protein